MTEILYLNLQMSYDFQIFCFISIPPRRHWILFHLTPIFQLLPSKIGTINKIETLQKRLQTIQCQLRQRTRNIVWNPRICGVTNSNSFRNPGKVKVLRYVLCVEGISVLNMEERMISINIRTPPSIRDMWMLHNNKEN